MVGGGWIWIGHGTTDARLFSFVCVVYGWDLYIDGFDWRWRCMWTVVRGSVQEEC